MEETTTNAPETTEAATPFRDQWIEVARIVMSMPKEEQARCLAATAVLCDQGAAVVSILHTCSLCGGRVHPK